MIVLADKVGPKTGTIPVGLTIILRFVKTVPRFHIAEFCVLTIRIGLTGGRDNAQMRCRVADLSRTTIKIGLTGGLTLPRRRVADLSLIAGHRRTALGLIP